MVNNESNELSVPVFWRHYGSGSIVELSRRIGDGYSGRIVRGRVGEEYSFHIDEHCLKAYKYEGDPKFAIGVFNNLNNALHAIVSAPLMEVESMPNIMQLRLLSRLMNRHRIDHVSYMDLRDQMLSALERVPIAVSVGLEELRLLKPGASEYQRFKESGRLSCLNCEREILIKAVGLLEPSHKRASAIMEVVSNFAHEDVDTVNIAIWAAGRLNHKELAGELVSLLQIEEFALHFAAAEFALQFMCSGAQLIPIPTDKDRHLYWKSHLPIGNTEELWSAIDGVSVFWEKRLRYLLSCFRKSRQPDQLQQFYSDEVRPVSLLARALWPNVPSVRGSTPPFQGIPALSMSLQTESDVAPKEEIWRFEAHANTWVWSTDLNPLGDKLGVIVVQWNRTEKKMRIDTEGFLELGEGFELAAVWRDSAGQIYASSSVVDVPEAVEMVVTRDEGPTKGEVLQIRYTRKNLDSETTAQTVFAF